MPPEALIYDVIMAEFAVRVVTARGSDLCLSDKAQMAEKNKSSRLCLEQLIKLSALEKKKRGGGD